MTGVYLIKNLSNGKVYVGSSIDMDARIKEHMRTLRNETHRNIYLKRAWHKYGEDSFEFSIIEETENEKLIEREQFWMDRFKSYNPESGYNICRNAGRTTGYKHTTLTREKLSELAKERSKEPNFHLRKFQFSKGHIMSKETLRKIGEASSRNQEGSLSHRAKLTDKDISEIVELIQEGKTDLEISESYGVTRKSISNIRTRKTFKSLTSKLVPYEGDIPRPAWFNRKGSRNPSAKLNEMKVQEIKERLASGESITDLSRDYKVSWSTIKLIDSGKTWKGVGINDYK